MTMELTAEHLRYLNVGMRYWEADLFKMTEEQRTVVRPYVRSFRQNIAGGKGLYIFGQNGTGKTYLASALLKYAWANWRVSGYLVTAAELKDSWITETPAHEYSEEHMDQRAENIRLLVIDDIGREHRSASGFAENKFSALLRTRSKGLKTTIMTSNIIPGKFGSIYGKASGKLINECMDSVCMDGVDMREKLAV